MAAYYNEHEPYTAQWLRNLIDAGHIAPGDVDERSIEDVTPAELVGYTQCHFFAGIGVWSYALRRAGISDDTPIWTGSCPCQPFSTAGEGAGFADERHLWPAFFHLIEQRQPATVVGEQVAGADAEPWIDLVQADMERLGYAFGTTPFPSAGVGAPHLRDRAYWAGVALGDPSGQGLQARQFASLGRARRREEGRAVEQPSRASGDLGNADSERFDAITGTGQHGREPHLEPCGGAGELADAPAQRLPPGAPEQDGRHVAHEPERLGVLGGLAHAARDGRRKERSHAGGFAVGDRAQGLGPGSGGGGGDRGPGPTNGPWRAADWLFCRDGRWRPIEPGASALAHGLAAGMGELGPELQRLASVAGLDGASLARAKRYRTGSLRGYGNAINAEAGRIFLECLRECAP